MLPTVAHSAKFAIEKTSLWYLDPNYSAWRHDGGLPERRVALVIGNNVVARRRRVLSCDRTGLNHPSALEGINPAVSKSSYARRLTPYIALDRFTQTQMEVEIYAAILDLARTHVRHPAGKQRFFVR
jgi:hypothetical protein